MPGIAGFTRTRGGDRSADARPTLEAMQELLTHRPFYRRPDAWLDDDIACTASVHFPAGWENSHRHRGSDGLVIWMHGEVFDDQGLADAPAARIAQRYRDTDDFDFLAALDGEFAGVIHDPARAQVHLFADRFGLEGLFWTVLDGELVWGSEVKTFLAHPDFRPVLRTTAIDEFLAHGHLLGLGTWFEGVTLLPIGSVLTWDLNRREASVQPYRRRAWPGADRDASPPLDEAVDRVGELLSRAVAKRTTGEAEPGVTLSGGLDSRAMFAAADEARGTPPAAASFGVDDSRDVHIARQVTDMAGARHLIHRVDERNWFDLRQEGVWWLDGHVSLRHMHGLALQHRASDLYEVNLNGFLGDALLGGEYWHKPLYEPFDVLRNRGRRFINEGVRLAETLLDQRRPFADRDLVDYLGGLPRSMIEEDDLYERVLLDRFPSYFESIPDATANTPISGGTLRGRLRQWRHAAGRSLRELGGERYRMVYGDYLEWLVGETNRDRFEQILFQDARLYPEHVPEFPVSEVWQNLVDGQSSSGWKTMYRLLTLEIWLQQVYERRWRPDADTPLEMT